MPSKWVSFQSAATFDLTKAWKTQVYFDQRGTLSKRFGITAVPTVISQQGAYLQVDEVPAKDLK